MAALVLLLFIMVALYAVAAWGWWWLLILRPTWRAWQANAPMPLPASLLLQFTIAVTCILALLGFEGLLWTLGFPIGALALLLLAPPLQLVAVIAQNGAAVGGGLLAAVATAGLMISVKRPFAHYLLLPCSIVGTVVALHMAEQRSAIRMEERAEARGAECMARNSFRESLTFWGREMQSDLHAIALIDGAWHGWSYRDDDFYLPQDRTLDAGHSLKAECLDQVGDVD